ncbi:MAG: hypothetical protein M3145_07400, partial [Pseudomonadota bacterium]|nr:hypothetical protein [Pseudomonadota bacterium]
DPNMPDSDVTLDMICEKLIIHGSPRKVADGILALREEIGDFGTLLYAGMDWQDRDLARRSMILMAEQVLALVNTASPKAAALSPKLDVTKPAGQAVSWPGCNSAGG